MSFSFSENPGAPFSPKNKLLCISVAVVGPLDIDLIGVPGYMVGLGVPAAAVDLVGNELLLILDAVPVIPAKYLRPY